MAAHDPVHEQVHISKVFLPEKSVLILLQFLGHINNLLIMNQQFTNIASNFINADEVILVG